MKLMVLLLLAAQPLFAHTFRIAGLYPESMAGHFNCTCGLEAQCMTKAAVKEARKQGLDVTVDLFESGRSPLTTADSAKKIVAAGNYDAAVGTLVSAEALVAADVFESAKIPFVAPTASNPEVTRGKAYVTRIAFNDYRQAMLLAKLTAKDLKAKNVAIIRNQSNPYSEFLGLQFAKDLRERGVSVAEYPILEGFSDFKPLVQKFVKNGNDLVFVPLSQAMLASLYVELVQSDAKLTLLGSDIVEGEVQFLKSLGHTPATVPFIFVKHWNGKLQGPRAKDYSYLRNTYCKKYEETMTGVAAYDAISIVLETLKENKNTTKENLIPRLRAVKYAGMTGRITYDHSGDPIKPLQLFRIHNNHSDFWRTYQ